MRQLVPSSLPLVIALALVGCADSHEGGEPGVDAGSRDGGGGARCDRDTGPIGPPFYCVEGFSTTCSDLWESPLCVGGTWQCPAGYLPQDESPCVCSGARPPGCTCGPSGWVCDAADAGTTASCPEDPVSAEGTACAEEGRSCGRCLDSCGFCNILRCEGGTWTRLEAHPRPPPCTAFECGPELRCAAELEYCAHTLSDVAGIPDDYRCLSLPPDCRACSCLPSPDACEQGEEGGLTVTLGGG